MIMLLTQISMKKKKKKKKQQKLYLLSDRHPGLFLSEESFGERIL